MKYSYSKNINLGFKDTENKVDNLLKSAFDAINE